MEGNVLHKGEKIYILTQKTYPVPVLNKFCYKKFCLIQATSESCEVFRAELDIIL